MKIAKMVYFDPEQISMMQRSGENVSELIRKAVKAYFDSQVPKDKKELERRMKILELKKKFNKDLEAIENGKA